MKKTSKNLVFFGNERLSSGFRTTTPTLKSLINNGYNIKAIIVNQASKGERKLEIAEVATKNHIPILSPQKPADILTTLRDLGADAGILVAYGKIVPEEVINIFPCGILNIHPSLLPLYRGPTPIEQAILDGAKITGVSIIRLTRKMDAGPVYAQQKIKLTGKDKKQTLTENLLNEGSKLLLNNLPDILSGQLQPKPQDEARASYCSLISKASRRIDWGKPATQIEREVRAYAGWPKSYCSFGATQVIVIKCEATDMQHKIGEIIIEKESLSIGCGVGSVKILLIQPFGKKIMTTTEFLNGYRGKIKNITGLD